MSKAGPRRFRSMLYPYQMLGELEGKMMARWCGWCYQWWIIMWFMRCFGFDSTVLNALFWLSLVFCAISKTWYVTLTWRPISAYLHTIFYVRTILTHYRHYLLLCIWIEGGFLWFWGSEVQNLSSHDPHLDACNFVWVPEVKQSRHNRAQDIWQIRCHYNVIFIQYVVLLHLVFCVTLWFDWHGVQISLFVETWMFNKFLK